MILVLVGGIASLNYGIVSTKLPTLERITIALTGLLFSLSIIFKIGHYPFANELKASMFIPITMFLTTTIKHKFEQPKEFGFMLIWVSIAISRLIKYWYE